MVPKFEFELQKVLKVRAIRENLALYDFLQAKKEKESVERHLNQLNNVQHDICDFIKQEQLDLYQMIHARDFLHNNRVRIKEKEEQLQQKEQVVIQKKDNLIEKRKKRRVLDNLKEKKKKQHYKEMVSREQKEIDEVAVTYYAGGLS